MRYCRKIRGTVIDAEIAGRRTLISVRTDFFPDAFNIFSKGEIAVSQGTAGKI